MSEWIPCNKALPERNVGVLVTYIIDGNTKKRYIKPAEYWPDDEGGHWTSIWDEYKIDRSIERVIAWMPYPMPYKGVIDND